MILIKLILAHLIGDFLLQPGSWVKAKENKKIGAYQLYLHAIIHFILIMLLVWDLQFWFCGLILSASHFLTDVIKLYAQQEKNRRDWFFIDQLIHFLLILLIWFWSQNEPAALLSGLRSNNIVLVITMIYGLTQPTSIMVSKAISKWTAGTESNSDSLENAGKYIGILERLFVFVFVITDNWEAIGFLLAAKSVFRFGDLKESKDRKLTEYVLIGTLLSFGIAVLCGLVFQYLHIKALIL